MVPPDGTRAPRIPALSWDPVVDSSDDPAAPQPAPAAPVDVEPAALVVIEPVTPFVVESAAPPPPATPAPAPTAEPTGFEPLHLDPASLESAASPPRFGAPAASDPLPTEPDERPVVRTTPPAVIVPAIGDVISGADVVASPPAADPAPVSDTAPVTDEAPPTDALPEIREATPVVNPGAPLLPSVQLPVQRATASPHSTFEFDAASVAPAPARQPHRRSSRRGLKLLATLVVLGGVVAAGVVFGQPYLFPGDWDAATEPYALAVESSRGVEFVEPLSIVAEPTAEFAVTLQTQLAPTSPAQLAEWRALGLSSGAVDDATLAAQLTGWQDAVYSTDDGQVYHDLGAAGAELDAQLVQVMAAAALDQEYGWSVEQAQRTLDGAATTSAEVLRQARDIQTDSSFDGSVAPVRSTEADALPPVVGYRAFAPYVFAEFAGEDDPNPLRGLGPVGPGPLGDEVPVVAGDPSMLDGDTVVDTPTARDRSFWFLVFGGFLDGPTAFAASEAIVENSVTHAVRGTTECVYATFSGGGVDETEVLRSALGAWVASTPAEMASSLTALPNGSLQLSTCDPGVGFPGAARTGVVAELVAYRSLELATAEAVADQGGGDPEFAYVWKLIRGSNMLNDVAAVAVDATPSEIAAAATDAVAALYSLAG